jgi:Na+/proline symporter
VTGMNRGFTWLDWTVLLAYFIGITLMGLWISRKVQSSGGYFLGDRKLRWWIMMGQAFGTGTHAEQPVAQTGATCELGFATIWYQWKNMLITPFYWLIAPWYRRSQRTTIGEIIEDRYGRGLALLYTLFAISYFVFNQGAMLKGAAKVISIATGGHMISPNGVVVVMTLAFLVYSFFGGLLASAYTDFVQSFLIIVLSFLLIPRGLAEVGGFTGMRAVLPENFFVLYSEASRLDAFTIAMLAVNGLVGIVAQPHILSMCATGNNERAGRIGQTYGSMVKRFCTIGWAITGLIVAAMLVNRGQRLPEREAAFGFACRELLGPGLVGLMIACVLAANMSTCSNFMVNTGALFTRNLYREYVNPAASDGQLLRMGRVSGLLLTLLGIAFAIMVDKVLDAFLFTETIAAFMGIMFMGGILWRRANRQGALAATLTAFGVYYALLFSTHGTLRLVYPWTAAPFGWAMLAGCFAFIAVSLLTRSEDPGRIAAFFEKMRFSSDDDAHTADGRRVAAAERGEDLLLVDLPGWLDPERRRGFWRRYREDIVGFVLGWLTVILLIATAWALMQLGR